MATARAVKTAASGCLLLFRRSQLESLTYCSVRQQLEKNLCSAVRHFSTTALHMLETIGLSGPSGFPLAHSECLEAKAISRKARLTLNQHTREHGC